MCYMAPMHFLEPAWPSSLDKGTSTTSLGELSTAPRIRTAGCLTWPEASHKVNVVLLLIFSRIKRKIMLSKALRYMPQESRPSCTVSNAPCSLLLLSVRSVLSDNWRGLEGTALPWLRRRLSYAVVPYHWTGIKIYHSLNWSMGKAAVRNFSKDDILPVVPPCAWQMTKALNVNN